LKATRGMTLVIMGCLIVCGWGNLKMVHAQDGTRGLKPEEAGIVTNPRRKKRNKPITFRTLKPFRRTPAPAGTRHAQVGVTIWLVDSGQSKGVEQIGEEQLIERLDTNDAYAAGDTIRLRIESPTGGYLYIVDQEQYADGTYGPAMLAFPTLKLRKGNNVIQPWQPIDIPAYPSVWRFRARELKEGETRKVQTAEVLTVIISPKPLVDPVRITDRQLALGKGEFENWRAKWQTAIQQFDLENAVGQAGRTKGIEQLGEEADAEDALGPQTTYRVAVKRGNPVWITVPLRFRTRP
jgi:hypothetical protein